MKLWYTMFILTFIILYGTLSLAILGSWAYETARGLRVRRPLSSRKGLQELLVVVLTTLTVSVSPLYAGSQAKVVNLRGDQVLVPMEVPSKERFVLQQLISVDNRLIVFLYRDPKFRRPVDYAETYNLRGELLEIAWVEPTGGLTIARDVNLGNPEARDPARVLEIIDLRPNGLFPDRRPDDTVSSPIEEQTR
ncbi:MAG: hypothetical protein ACREKR_06245 [Candidatus Methylomirabilales bacterium]